MAGTVNLRGILVILWTILTLVTRCAADAVDDLATVSRENVYKILNGSLSDGATHSTCTKDKLVVRREWCVSKGRPVLLRRLLQQLFRGTLSIPERDAYIQAVLCLMSKPSKFSASVAPGAKNRYDDFVGVHVRFFLLKCCLSRC
jgi:tyrosinase